MKEEWGASSQGASSQGTRQPEIWDSLDSRSRSQTRVGRRSLGGRVRRTPETAEQGSRIGKEESGSGRTAGRRECVRVCARVCVWV